MASQISHICQAFLRYLISASHILLKTIFLKCYLFFAPQDGPITSETVLIHVFKEMMSQG